MSDPQKSVFISYRRANSQFLALLLFKELTERGFDVFIDTERIDSGDFRRIILSQIASRTHFVIILRPGTLERCVDEDDWVRREIEYAIEKNRNIIPLLSDGFEFNTEIDPYLQGELAKLPNYNGMNLYSDFFDAAVDKLVKRFLKAPEYEVELETLSKTDAEVAAQHIQKIEAETRPNIEAISAEALFARGYAAEGENDYDKAYRYYTSAITLKPDYTKAYFNRGNIEYQRGNKEAALRDYEQAILIDKNYAKPHLNRGLLLLEKGEEDKAFRDIERSIQLKPDLPAAYYNRAMIYQRRGQIEDAINDYEKFLALENDDNFHIQQAQNALAYLKQDEKTMPWQNNQGKHLGGMSSRFGKSSASVPTGSPFLASPNEPHYDGIDPNPYFAAPQSPHYFQESQSIPQQNYPIPPAPGNDEWQDDYYAASSSPVPDMYPQDRYRYAASSGPLTSNNPPDRYRFAASSSPRSSYDYGYNRNDLIDTIIDYLPDIARVLLFAVFVCQMVLSFVMMRNQAQDRKLLIKLLEDREETD